MRIVFLHHVFQTGSGIEQVIIELATHLETAGHNASVVTYNDEYSDPHTVPVTEFRLPIRGRIPGSVLAPTFVKTNRDIRKALDGCDVVVTSLYPMSLVPLFPRKLRAKIVFIDWGVQPYYAYRSPVDKAYLWLLKQTDKYAVRHSDLTIVANKVTKKWVEKQGVQPVHLNLYGVNFDRLRIVDTKYLRERHREKLASAHGIIMFAGRQSPHKNIDITLRAVAQLNRTGAGIKFIIVGRESFPEHTSYLKDLVHLLGIDDDVIFTGLVSEDDLAGYYSLCDAFVNASSWEGYLIAEPYAFGKPIVAYNVAPHEETVQNGITGVLVDQLTPEAFANGTIQVLFPRVARQEMGEAGYRWARKNLDYEVITEKFVKVIEGGSP